MAGGLHMPKVTDKYLTDKRNYILKCTGEILKEKPLYSVTMRDIIKKAGFSQGIIYHYFASLDEIYVDYINQNTTYNLLEQNINTLISSRRTEKEILLECIIAIGKYIEELLKSVGGRTCFEFTVIYACDFEKRAKIFPNLKFKQSIEYAQNKIMEYILYKVEKDVFHPQTPVDSIFTFMGSCMDGIAQSVATGTTESSDNATDISIMVEMLAKAVIGFFGV